MAKIIRNAIVPFSAEQMYRLVNDVNAYPEFLPSCTGSRIIENSDSQMTASVEVAKAGLCKTFTTRNFLTEGKQIQMQLVDGPFRQFSGGWQFIGLGDSACKVELSLDFEFSNMLVEMAFGRVFKQLANNMVQAFTRRAKEIYGV